MIEHTGIQSDETGAAAVPGVTLVGPVAVVPIAGAIVEDAAYGWWGTPVDWIAAALDACRTDGRVEGVLLSVNSPGGETGRFAHATDAMAALREAKPTVAYIEGTGLSAAYWLASMAHGVWADSPWAYVGMVGTFAAIPDTSKQLEMFGVRMHYATDTPRKTELNDGVEVTPEAVSHIASVIEPNARAFRETVAAYRGIDPGLAQSRAEPLDGRIYSAEQGLGIGLVDEIVPAAKAVERAAGLFDQLAMAPV